MPSPSEKAAAFLALHRPGQPLLIPNPWDAGSAKILESLGFEALATTSGGFAGSLGRPDGRVSREEALAHATSIAAAVDVPVSADLENCFADDPEGVAGVVRAATETGLAGCSVEDYTHDGGLYDLARAKERVAAAAEAAHSGPFHFVLTARAENHIRNHPDLSDTIARLQAFQEAGADVLYAPGLTHLDDIAAVVKSVDRPVNVLALGAVPPVAELARAGVARISIGSAFATAAWGALVQAAEEFRQAGTYGFSELSSVGSKAARTAFAAR